LIAEEYLAPLHEVDVDVLILGCTHYPLLAPVIREILGPQVTLVDSAHETALEVRAVLAARGALRNEESQPRHDFYASDSPMRFHEVGRRFLGEKVTNVERVVVEGMRTS
jgi:glutamate racemase